MNYQLEGIILCLRRESITFLWLAPKPLLCYTYSFSRNSGSVQEDISWYIQINPVCSNPRSVPKKDHKKDRRWAVCTFLVLIRRYLLRFFAGFRRKLNFHVVGSLRFVLLIKNLLDLLTWLHVICTLNLLLWFSSYSYSFNLFLWHWSLSLFLSVNPLNLFFKYPWDYKIVI